LDWKSRDKPIQRIVAKNGDDFCQGSFLVSGSVAQSNCESSGQDNLERLKSLLTPWGQQHLIAFWEQLNSTQRESLATQILSMDLERLARLRREQSVATDWERLAKLAEPPPMVSKEALAKHRADGDSTIRTAGEQSIKAGHWGVLLVAGGQGSRLGFEQPKGMFPIGPVSGRSLFQMHCDTIRAVGDRYGHSIALMVMTSRQTHDQTVQFFETNHFFGLDARLVRFFQQGEMPSVDCQSGKILMDSPGAVATNPDGHGGMLEALIQSGTLSWAESLGVRHFFYGQVDNPLVPWCDPVLIGLHLDSASQATTLGVAKSDPMERVGNIVQIEGHIQIIEYSDLPEEIARQRQPDGSLKIGVGNIAVHLFDLPFLQSSWLGESSLPFHCALKKVPFVDELGTKVSPENPNAVKYERFIFDLLPVAATSLVVEVEAAECFAPVKNADGLASDTPDHCRRRICALHRRWLEQAGIRVADGIQTEISPCLALESRHLPSWLLSLPQLNHDTFLTRSILPEHSQ
jgi:UDP-N-acetylglucosamine/UDP-N-acetylgalactosamine diphosphorylase